MAKGNPRPRRSVDVKLASLQATGTLNGKAQAVKDPLFRAGGFFDARDLLQIRYEMVRRHLVENEPVINAAQLFGVSVPTVYQAQAAFKAGGLVALLPQRRGPKHGHKLTPVVLLHIEQCRRERPNLRAGDLLPELQRKFGLTVHRRSLERLLAGKKKLSNR